MAGTVQYTHANWLKYLLTLHPPWRSQRTAAVSIYSYLSWAAGYIYNWKKKRFSSFSSKGLTLSQFGSVWLSLPLFGNIKIASSLNVAEFYWLCICHMCHGLRELKYHWTKTETIRLAHFQAPACVYCNGTWNSHYYLVVTLAKLYLGEENMKRRIIFLILQFICMYIAQRYKFLKKCPRAFGFRLQRIVAFLFCI